MRALNRALHGSWTSARSEIFFFPFHLKVCDLGPRDMGSCASPSGRIFFYHAYATRGSVYPLRFGVSSWGVFAPVRPSHPRYKLLPPAVRRYSARFRFIRRYAVCPQRFGGNIYSW